jgi:5-methylcytosine-specific restriction protein B
MQVQTVDKPNDEYELKGPDANAKGVLTKSGFLVKAGSIARRETVPSGKKVVSVHQKLLADGVLKEHQGKLRFAKDHLFRSPSGAAGAILGGSANGWITWKNSAGETLSKIRGVSRGEQHQLLSAETRSRIQEQHERLLNEGKLPSVDQLEREYLLFRERFGPDVLKSMDGEALLSFMHDHRRTDSLVFWLEWKNDEEFQTRRLGSIAGGSALKFRIFRRKETGRWQAGSEKGNRPVDISVEEAIDYAKSHRDQLVLGCELLDALPSDASDDDYAQLQDQLDELAPDVSRLAWGHKYFSIMFPNKLDDYHSPIYQRFHLLKLLQLPPEGDGRYVCAGRFVDSAKEAGICMNHFSTTINTLHGSPHKYWRVGTTYGKSGTSFWQMMQNENCIAIGWKDLGDISWVDGKEDSREKLKTRLSKVYPNDPRTIGRDASQLEQFTTIMTEGDIVLAADGMTILGVGRVAGGYEFKKGFDFPHQRKIDWLNTEPWQLPQSSEGLLSTVRELGKSNENLLAIEKQIHAKVRSSKKGKTGSAGGAVRLAGIAGRIQSILDRKSQVVLYGPPGTGKTYWAEKTANDLAAILAYRKLFEDLSETEQKTIVGKDDEVGLVRLCCFHPAYGYEDFIEGYRPKTINGNISFDLRDGVFKRLCKDAAAAPERDFFLVVDEINRGDIPRIFGELLTTIEKDKRGKKIVLPVSQELFSVPKNIFLIGTMNTADRSISLFDAALRRRFGWVELMPDSGVLKESSVSGIALKAWLDALNARVRGHVGRDARNLQIGHSYLMQGGTPIRDLATLKRAIRDDIIPLLEEYCYEDFEALSNILGDQLVDQKEGRICYELFDEGQEDEFKQALLTPFAEISTSTDAISSTESKSPEDDDETGDDS